MSFFAASPFLKALGWALVNSLWQFAVCWLIYRSFIAGIQKISAALRHGIALVLLFSGTVSFMAGLSWKYYANATESGDHAPVIAGAMYYNIWHAADSTIDTIMPYWSLLYLVCVVFLLIKFCLFVQRAGNLQKNGITKMDAQWRLYVNNIAAQLGIQQPVNALLSVHIDTPQVIGFLKPVILLPAACLVNLSTEQLEAVLLHELVHIKRNDYLVNLFVTSIEILFFFNPFVKQMTASIRKEREYSCDDMVIQFQYHPHNYAAALLTLEKNRMMPVTYGIAASGKNEQQLLTRIERILGIKNKQSGGFKLGACLMALLLLGFIATINPAKMAVDKFGTDGLLLANNIIGLQYSDETNSNILHAYKPATVAKKERKVNNRAVLATMHTAAKNDPANDYSVMQVDYNQPEEQDADDDVETAARVETIDFSLRSKETPFLPATPQPTFMEPYVPASSFSCQLTQDTAMPKIKGDTYNERMAKDALLKAQKAMEQINWQKIEKQLKYKKQDIIKLKNELVLQIQKLNWQKINSEVKDQLGLEQLQGLQDAVKQGQTLKEYRQYQASEAYQESLNKLSVEQTQLIRENALRLQESQKEAEKQLKKLQAELKKRRIIYI